MEAIFFFYPKAVIFKQFTSLHKKKNDLTAVGLVTVLENFTGAKNNRARKHFFQDSHKWDAHLLCYFINSMSTQACNTAL